MRVIKQKFIIESHINGENILISIEKAGRTCYKSEAAVSRDSASKFVKKIIDMGHESVLEHVSITVRVICDRGVSHEIVRHRIASYSQESTRYCNYGKEKFGSEITFIEPCFWTSGTSKDLLKKEIWIKAMEKVESAYFGLLEQGASAQEARSVLPNSLKTELVMTMNLREWRHFFRLRTSPTAHPQMREIAVPLLKEFRRNIPVIYDDI